MIERVLLILVIINKIKKLLSAITIKKLLSAITIKKLLSAIKNKKLLSSITNKKLLSATSIVTNNYRNTLRLLK